MLHVLGCYIFESSTLLYKTKWCIHHSVTIKEFQSQQAWQNLPQCILLVSFHEQSVSTQLQKCPSQLPHGRWQACLDYQQIVDPVQMHWCEPAMDRNSIIIIVWIFQISFYTFLSFFLLCKRQTFIWYDHTCNANIMYIDLCAPIYTHTNVHT